MIAAFRLCKTKHLPSAFTGEGASLNGGRWNSPGYAVVYTSSSLSLATLEVLVHLEDPAAFANLFSWIPIEIPEALVERIDPATLPDAWAHDEINIASRSIGDSWLRSMQSAVLAVPSVITPGEWNYLLNPGHSDFSKIGMGKACEFQMNRRLLK